MRTQQRGLIINMSSVAGRVSTPFAGWYAASKHAVEALSDALRLGVAPFGVHVVLVEPGAIRSGFDNVALSGLDATTSHPEYATASTVFGTSLASAYARAQQPEIVARQVERAMTSRRPKTRYATPFATSALVITARRLLSDRALDRAMQSQLGLPR